MSPYERGGPGNAGLSGGERHCRRGNASMAQRDSRPWRERSGHPFRTLNLSSGSTVQAYRALQQTGVSRAHVGEHLSQRDALGRLQLKVMVANRTREIRPSGMKRGACGNVSVMGVGLRPIGKSMEAPPDPYHAARTALLSQRSGQHGC